MFNQPNYQYGQIVPYNSTVNNLPQLQQRYSALTGGVQAMPIGSLEEMKSIPTDFSGGVILGIDKGNQCIYSKYLDVTTGIGRIDIYKLVTDLPQEQKIAPSAIIDRINLLDEKIDKFFSQLPKEEENK